MTDDQNLGDDVLRIAREQNVSQASALRGALIMQRLDRKLARRKERLQQWTSCEDTEPHEKHSLDDSGTWCIGRGPLEQEKNDG